MRVVLPVLGIFIGIGVAAALVAPSGPADGPEGVAAARPGEGPGTGMSDGGALLDEKSPNRCPEKIRQRLVVRGPDAVLLDTPIAGASAEVPMFKVRSGRHQGDMAIALGALLDELPGATSLEVLPCTGEARKFSRAELAADPERYFLVSAKRAALKLMDRDGDPKKPVMKNLAEVRLRR